MRDLLAAIIAVGLLLLAASLATTLHAYRRRRLRAFDSERAMGRHIVAELPTAEEMVLFSEDTDHFYYSEHPIDKELIVAVRVLINGSPIAAVLSTRHGRSREVPPTSFEDRPEGIARDRWDVAIEALSGTVLVECGSIRERVSQELARAVFEAVRGDVEGRSTL